MTKAGLILIVISVVFGPKGLVDVKHWGVFAEINDKPSLYSYKNAAVVSDAGPCSEIGREMLLRGGSAVDASIATTLCLGVLEFKSVGIGGGHFFMYYHKDTQQVDVIDATVAAPLGSSRDMYINDSLSKMDGAKSIAIPGEIAGHWKAHQLYGKLPWRTLFEPSIDIARSGFRISSTMHHTLIEKLVMIRRSHSLGKLLFNKDGSPKKEGDVLYMPKLADTLEKIACGGVDAFYRGQLAVDIVKDIQDNGGIITLQDLEQYEAKVRQPLVSRLSDGLLLYTPPPPTSGAILSLILNIIDGFEFTTESFIGTNSLTQTYHKTIEAFKFGYAQRILLGDPDYVNVAQLVSNITSQSFANSLRPKISADITHEASYYGQVLSVTEDHGTSHICVLDQYGNAVSVTSSIYRAFGSKVIGKRTGILFNNAMDDFSYLGEADNYYGLPTSQANYIIPGKRPMSSRSPTIIVNDAGVVKSVTGGSGGSRIPSTVAQVITKHLLGGIPISEAVNQARLHHQWLPNVLQCEVGSDQVVLGRLREKGHDIDECIDDYLSIVQGISHGRGGEIEACSDGRKGGYPAGF